jgi:hypothetical protein
MLISTIHGHLVLAVGASGGAIAVDGRAAATVSITSTNFSSNTGKQQAGAVYVQSPVLSSSITDCTFSNNSSPAGGGVFVQVLEDMKLLIQGCTFTNCSSVSSGGGGLLQQGEELRIQLVNNSFSQNSAQCCFAGTDLSAYGGSCLDISAGYGTSW